VTSARRFRVTYAKSPNDRVENTHAARTIAFIIGKKFETSPSLATYMDLKASLGFNVAKIIVGGAITTPEQIRAELKTLLVNTSAPLAYAIIIGDIADVPAKTSSNMSGSTDNYYRAIDTNDYNTDLGAPDIGLGRISATDETQLAGILTKYTRYSKGDFADTAWQSWLSFLGTSDSSFSQLAEGTHNYVIDTYTAQRGYRGNFPTANAAGGDKLYAITHRATGANVMTAAQAGRAMIIYSGHGSSTSFAGPSVSASNVKSLAHADAMPVVTGFACNTAMFSVGESFAETWQRHPKGAIFYWGSWDSSYWDEDDILERRMMDAIFRDGVRDFGTITNKAMVELWKHYGGAGKSKYYVDSYAMFADPSVELRLPIGM
jgi:Peptidase family C25